MTTDTLIIASSIDQTMFGGILKLGAGTLILSGTNSYIGNTVVDGGTLAITGDSSADSAGTYAVYDGVLQIASTGLIDNASNIQLGYNGASTTNGVLELGDAGGAVNVGFDILTSTGGTGGTTGNAIIGNSAANSTLTINSVVQNANFAGTIGGSGTNNNHINIIKTGALTQIFSGTNTYTGSTTVTGGTLDFTGNSTAIGTTVNVQNGAVQVGFNTTVNSGASGINPATALTFGSGTTSGVFALGDANGAVNQTLASLTTSGTGTGNAVIGNATANSVLTVNNSAADTFSGNIGGTGTNNNALALIKSGTGTLTLSGNDTYTGGTTLSGGSLNLGSAGALGTTGSINFAGGTLQYSPANSTDYSSRIMGSASPVAIDTNSQAVTFATALPYSSAVTKIGAGTLTLSAANNYIGATIVNNGTLALANGSLGGTAITVNSSGTFAGLGNVTIGATGSPTVTINSGGILSTVDGTINTLTINSATSGATVLNLAPTGTAAILNMEVGTNADEIVLGSGLQGLGRHRRVVNIVGLGSLTGTSQTLISAPGGGLSGTFLLGTITGNTSGYNFTLTDTGTALVLNETIAAGGNAFYTGAGGSVWSTGSGANFNTLVSGGTALTAPPGGGVTNVFIAASALSGTTSTTLGQNLSINSLSFTGSGPASTTSFTLAADGNTLTLNAANGFTDQNSNSYAAGTGLVVQNGSAAQTIAASVLLGRSQTWEIDNSAANALTVSGSVSDSGLGFSLTKTGTGTLIISGANTYGHADSFRHQHLRGQHERQRRGHDCFRG